MLDGLEGVGGGDVAEGLFEREGVLGAEREEDGVVVGGGLEFEVEAHAEALAEGEAPGSVDALAKGGVDDQLHAAGVVEEALEDDVVVRGHDAEAVVGGAQVVGDLVGAELRDVAFGLQPVDQSWVGEPAGHVAA